MNKIDRYISTKFLNILFFALISFCVMFVIVDMVEFLDNFIDKQVPRLIILEYYLYYLPYIIVLVLPIAVLLSTLFSIGQLARYNELTAMQTSGVSLYRIALPLLTLGLLISIFMILFGEYVVPRASENKFEIKRKYLDQVPSQISGKQSNINILQSETQRTNIGYFDADSSTAHDVSVQTYTAGRLLDRYDAKKMIYKNKHWILMDGMHREFNNTIYIAQPFKQKVFPDFQFQPADLKQAQKQPDEMNFVELKQFIHQIVRSGADPQKWLVELYLKIAFPFSNFIIILFGIPLAAMQKRSGAALGFAISLVICFVFFGLVKTFQTLGHNDLINPLVSAWASNIIIGTIGLILMVKIKK